MIRITRFQNVGFSTPKKIEKKVVWCPPFGRQKKWQYTRWGPPWVNYSVIHQKILWKKEATFIYHHNKYSAAHFRGLVQHDYALEKLWFMMILLIDNHFLLVEPFWHVLTCFATAHKQIIDFCFCLPCLTGNPRVNFDFSSPEVWLYFQTIFVRRKECELLATAKAVKMLENNFSDRLLKEAFEISTLSEI